MASKNFFGNIVAIVKALNRRAVRYLVVGGSAVGFHGFLRPTTNREGVIVENDDFDFWFQPTYLNYKKLLNALDDLGFDVAKYKNEEHPFPKSAFFRFKTADYSLDFLPRVGGGLTFTDCFQRRMISIVENDEINIISLDDLITAKKFAGRPKDLEDIEALNALHKR